MSNVNLTISPTVAQVTVAPVQPALTISGVTSIPSGSAGGDLGGSYPNPTVDGLQGRAVASTAPSNGQLLAWNDLLQRWEPTTMTGGTGTVTQVSSGTGLTGGPITTSGTLSVDFAASGSATAGKAVEATDSRLSNARTPTGSAGGSLSGTYPNPSLGNNVVDSAQLVDDSVTLAKIQNIATARLLGNSSGVTSSPQALSVSSPLGFNAISGNLEFVAPGTNGQVYYRSGGSLATTANFAFDAASSTVTLTDPASSASATYSWDSMLFPAGFFQQTAALGSFFLGDYLGLGNGTLMQVDDSASAFNFTADTITRNGFALITEDDAVALAVAL